MSWLGTALGGGGVGSALAGETGAVTGAAPTETILGSSLPADVNSPFYNPPTGGDVVGAGEPGGPAAGGTMQDVTATGLPTKTLQDYAKDYADAKKKSDKSKGAASPPMAYNPPSVGASPGWSGSGLPQYPTLASLAQARLASNRGVR